MRWGRCWPASPSRPGLGRSSSGLVGAGLALGGLGIWALARAAGLEIRHQQPRRGVAQALPDRLGRQHVGGQRSRRARSWRRSPRRSRAVRSRSAHSRSNSKFSRKLRASQLEEPIRHHSPSTVHSLEWSKGAGVAMILARDMPEEAQMPAHRPVHDVLVAFVRQHDLHLDAAQARLGDGELQPRIGQEIGRDDADALAAPGSAPRPGSASSL